MSEITDGLHLATRLMNIKQNVQTYHETILASKKAQHDEAKQQLDNLQNEQESVKNVVTDVLNAPERYLHFHQLDVLSVKQALQQEAVDQTAQDVENQRIKVQDAYQDTERWKMLFEQYNQTSQLETKHQEQKALDDGASALHQLHLKE